MDGKLLKPYDPKTTEHRIYKLWEESGFFNPDNLPGNEDGKRKEAFTIMMPPPNVTGVLHMGHALMITLEDIMIRYKRMRGFKTLWLPGTDHAAIATQSKVEKEIHKKEGKTRHDLGREEMLKRINDFALQSHDVIVSQIKVLGASCDWSREAFTLDEKRNLAVNTMFKKMYEDGLIYRGNRIVNWDPKGQTTISDDEVVYEERKGKFYTFKYGPFEIGTARPETKFGDKYVVMHPKDERYKDWKHNQKITVEWINGPIEATIIKDDMIDMEFGTGVMTITPAHSHEDFALAEKYKLDKEQIIDKYGKLLPIADEFVGMKITDAREKIVEKLKTKGLLVSIDENYVNRVATAERTGGIIEPQIMLQWFMDVNKPVKIRDNKTLKDLMREPFEKGEIKIIPEYFSKTYFHWIDNLHDWCISRQIWYGHRIPVWYHEPICIPKIGKEDQIGKCLEIIVNAEKPICKYCDANYIQDEDTLDTWFSSGLWTFSTLGWPEKTKDLATFHPTDVLETGYEILFFWVARMVLMSQYALGEIPFKNVFLHGTVRDAKGRKMSKSLNNGIDPLDIADKYGADAGRMALVVGTAPGTDSKISEDKIRGYKNFSNKIWNITRFILNNVDKSDFENVIQNKLTKEFNELAGDITIDMENYRFHLASEKIYQYIWHRFADEIIEETKEIIKTGGEKSKERKGALISIWVDCLKILHPFMPFVTEEIWSMLPNHKNLLMIEKWPF
jgi:valyl-tRNA synthetase